MSDTVVSVGLTVVEKQVLVRVLVEHEKPMMTDISESFSEKDGCYYGVCVVFVMFVLLFANGA